MRPRSTTVFAAIFGLSVVATILLFTVGGAITGEKTTSGKLSIDVIKVESDYKALQQEWLANEKDFLEAKPSVSIKLTGIQERFKALEKSALALRGTSPAEQAALPHLVGSIKASTRMVEPYVIRLMAPQRIGPSHWERKNADAREANAEWAAWQQATAEMSR